MAMEKQRMKPIRLITMGTLALFLGVLVPAHAQQDQGAKPEQHEQQTKPAKKQKAAKPSKQEKKQAKAQQKQQQKEQRTNTANQNQPRQDRSQPAHQQEAKGQQHGLPPGHQWAHSGQKDSRGHEYNPSRFGPDHHARFEQNAGREYNGHREYSYGGYWFYADTWPEWFFDQDVYFIMGDDGMWYAVSYDDPSLMIEVNIE
jgi:hypothetical protein